MNYTIEIDSGTTETDATLGLLDGVYTWTDDSDIVADKGISALKRAIDTRTGGGLSQQNLIKVTLMGGFYSKILNTANIIGKRITIKEGTNSTYIGVVSSADVIGFKTVLNCYVESRNRKVELSVSDGVIGKGEIDGTVSGESGTFETAYGNNFIGLVTNVTTSATDQNIHIKGGTLQSEQAITATVTNILNMLSDGYNVYYVGSNGTYKVTNASTQTGIEIKLNITVAGQLPIDENGEYGEIIWSNEVYNYGIDSTGIVVDGVTVDDINENIIGYKGGYTVDAHSGIVWKSMEIGRDFNISPDTSGLNDAVSDTYSYAHADSGLYCASFPVTPSNRTAALAGDGSSIVDKSNSTLDLATVSWDDQKEWSMLMPAYVFTMNGYELTADKVGVVVYAQSYLNSGGNAQGGVRSAQIHVTTRERSSGNVIGKRSYTYTPAVAPIGDEYIVSIPKTYDGSNRYNFYTPHAIDADVEAMRVDITDMFLDRADKQFYDGVDVYVAVGFEKKYTTTGDYQRVDIMQLNIVEGFEVGRDGLEKSKIIIDNSSRNGTIPLAYTDIVKRQNLFGINSTPPASGWGTEQVQTDGNGLSLDSNYIMDNIPSGNLEGIVSNPTTENIKKEIARSVPAVSCYDFNGVETLVELGAWDENATDEFLYTDVVGEVNLRAISGNEIQPALSFTFGQNKKVLKITNVEADTYNSSYVVNNIGLSPTQSQTLWLAGHRIYEKYGLSTAQSVKHYPIVNDADGAYRIARGLYGDMGYYNGVVFPRMTATFKTRKTVVYDVGTKCKMTMPQIKGLGVVTSFSDNPYSGEISYIVNVIDTETVEVPFDILITGSNADDILITGSNADDILITGGL